MITMKCGEEPNYGKNPFDFISAYLIVKNSSLPTLQLWEIHVIFCATSSRHICNMHQGDNVKSHKFP